jgi:hypothetical protein
MWAGRARNAGHIASDLADMAGDVKAAARRFGFARKMNIHPVESIEDPNIAAAAIADAYLALDDMPTREQREALQQSMRDVLQVNAATAEELLVLGHWMVNECGGAQPAISRLSKKLYRLEGPSALEPILQIIDQIAAEGSGVSIQQQEALHEIKTTLRVR